VAQQFSVTGWVANLSNGDVKVIVEGQASELQPFVQAVQTAMSGYIRGTEIEKRAATGEFSDFEIRHLG
jgi:acylphosphatase